MNGLFRDRIARYLGIKALSCQEAASFVSHSMDAKLSIRHRIELRRHLGICYCCIRYQQHLTVIREQMRQFRDQSAAEVIQKASLTPAARERVRQAVLGMVRHQSSE